MMCRKNECGVESKTLNIDAECREDEMEEVLNLAGN